MIKTSAGKAAASRAAAPVLRGKPFGALEQMIVRGIARGWVASDDADGTCPEVEFLIGSEPIGRCIANEPTPQSLRNDNRPVRGFHFVLPEQCRSRHSTLHLVARLVNSDVELIGSPLLLPPCPDIVGAVESLQSPAIEGWALDTLCPSRPVVVIAVQQGEIRATGSTQSGLEHLSRQGMSGDFRFRIPILTKSAEELSRMQVLIANTDQRLDWATEATTERSNLGSSSKSFNFLLD